ncbi:MAG: PqqD family protein [Clostridia bacterium]|nr:PqqD family protein [Clostridia bacterium]
MKLNKNFLVHKTDKETIVVPTGKAEFSGVVKGNQTLGTILDLLKKDTTIEKIVDSMLKEYDAPREVIEKDVRTTVSRLREIGAIDG